MAKKSFNQRVPVFKWVFLFAVVVSIPLTLWSINNVPTETRSHASTYTCSSSNPSGTCPSGYKCSYASDFGIYECKLTSLATPAGLTSGQWYCKFGNPPVEHDDASFAWNKVPNAMGYKIYYRIYSNVYNYAYKSVDVGNNTTYLKGNIYQKLNGRHIQWYVKAYSGSVISPSSAVKTTPTAYESCPN